MYGGFPAVPVADAEPLFPPLQVTLVGTIVTVGPFVFVTMADTVCVHPLASVMMQL